MDRLHPMAVHLPLALALLWPLVDLAGLLFKRTDVSKVGVALLVLGVLSSVVATATGQVAFDEAIAKGVDPQVLNVHADDANLMPWALLLILVVRWAAAHKLKRKGQIAGIALGLALWPFALRVGNSGGDLVFEHAIGVKAP